MKKNIIIAIFILSLIFTTKAYCEINAQNFIRHFSSCTKFMVNGDNRIHVMLGWSNRKCYYKEYSAKQEVTCGFKILELQDISKMMTKEGFNPNKGITSLRPASKYFSNSNVCEITTK